MDPIDLVARHPWIGLVAVLLLTASEVLGASESVRANGVVALAVDVVKAVASKLKPPTAGALVLAFLATCLIGCKNLGPAGRAAVATRIGVDGTDKACDVFLDHEKATLPAYVDQSVVECNPTPNPRQCYDDRVRAREVAIGACRAYGEARSSETARSAAKAALAAMGGAK